MPRPSHLMILALAAAALYIFALPSHNTLLALLAKPAPVLVLIAWLYGAPASLTSSASHRSTDTVLTQSGARSVGSC